MVPTKAHNYQYFHPLRRVSFLSTFFVQEGGGLGLKSKHEQAWKWKGGTARCPVPTVRRDLIIGSSRNDQHRFVHFVFIRWRQQWTCHMASLSLLRFLNKYTRCRDLCVTYGHADFAMASLYVALPYSPFAPLVDFVCPPISTQLIFFVAHSEASLRCMDGFIFGCFSWLVDWALFLTCCATNICNLKTSAKIDVAPRQTQGCRSGSWT